MLQIRFRRDSRQRLSSVLADGHADTAVAGEDVVCAAASAILQAAELGLREYAGLALAADRADGFMHIRIPADARERDDVRAIAGTAELAIRHLAWQFPVHVRCTAESEAAEVEEHPTKFLGNDESNGAQS